MKYLPHGILLVDKSMHNPKHVERYFVDALQAFWSTLQVLYGDISNAVKYHAVLNEVVNRHGFIPEAYDGNLNSVWDFHRLRPEFIESTYYLYKSTNDPYYISIGIQMIESLEKYSRTSCGYASIQSLSKMTKSNDMDSYVLSELFKYLYLLFVEDTDVPIDLEKYLFTTEGHFLPIFGSSSQILLDPNIESNPLMEMLENDAYLCSTEAYGEYKSLNAAAVKIRNQFLYHYYYKGGSSEKINLIKLMPLIENINLIDVKKIKMVRQVGMTLLISRNNIIHLLIETDTIIKTNDENINSPNTLNSFVPSSQTENSESIPLTKYFYNLLYNSFYSKSLLKSSTSLPLNKKQKRGSSAMVLIETQIEKETFIAGKALFGPSIMEFPNMIVTGRLIKASLIDGCNRFNAGSLEDNFPKIVAITRGNCLFYDKVLNAQYAGAQGVVVVDMNLPVGANPITHTPFDMSGIDGNIQSNITIPSVLVYNREPSILYDFLTGKLGSGCCTASLIS